MYEWSVRLYTFDTPHVIVNKGKDNTQISKIKLWKIWSQCTWHDIFGKLHLCKTQSTFVYGNLLCQSVQLLLLSWSSNFYSTKQENLIRVYNNLDMESE